MFFPATAGVPSAASAPSVFHSAVAPAEVTPFHAFEAVVS
jgi:hypothetical protein